MKVFQLYSHTWCCAEWKTYPEKSRSDATPRPARSDATWRRAGPPSKTRPFHCWTG